MDTAPSTTTGVYELRKQIATALGVDASDVDVTIRSAGGMGWDEVDATIRMWRA